MARYAFDIETNGLMPEVNTIHSLVLQDLDTGEVINCYPDGKGPDEGLIKIGLILLQEADFITGHNILSYDIPVIKHLYPWFNPKGQIRDTLIMAKMIWPMDNLKELDFPRWRNGSLPGQLIGAQKLEAWGYRMGLMKGEYSADVKRHSKIYQETGDIEKVPEELRVLATVNSAGKPCLDPWLAWNQPMQDYCVQDVAVTVKLFNLITSHLEGTAKAAKGVSWSPESVELEHRVWEHIDQQTARGYGFDRESAISLAGELKTRQRVLEDKLVEVFGSWWQPLDDPKTGKLPAKTHTEKLPQFKDVTIRRISDKTGKELKPYVGPPLSQYYDDAPFVRIAWISFNPKSRQHLGDRLQAVFGWKPVEFGGKDNKQAKVDETTIKAIPASVLPEDLKQDILEYLVVSKTLGQLADGKKSWIDFCSEDGRLRGRMDTLGTVSHRAAHYDPNLGQVPSVSTAKDGSYVMGWKGGFGVECRRLFIPKPGWYQTGIDASGLELRMLGHYLQPFDDGAFSERVSSPGLDIHAENAKITGLSRADTKTVTYAFLYGAGPLKIGMGVGLEGYDIEELANSGEARSYVGWMKRKFKSDFIQPDDETLAYIVRGSQVSKAFLEGITGLKDFKKDVTDRATARGFLKALDGRKLTIRKPHAAINQLLQGGGAVVCKAWMMETDDLIRKDYGLIPDVHYGQVAWVHDEDQYEHAEEQHHVMIAEASQRAIRNVGQRLNFRGLLDTEAKLGRNWQECH